MRQLIVKIGSLICAAVIIQLLVAPNSYAASQVLKYAYSCKELADRSPKPREFRHITINSGKEHGAFYLPDDQWIRPVVDWAKSSAQEPQSAY